MIDAAFHLSRIHAAGWNAAQKLSANELNGLDLPHLAALNPYTVEPERTRWDEGFTKALGG